MNVQSDFLLKGKIAIVTGGAGLLGWDFCETLSEVGAHVILADCDAKKGAMVAQDISEKTQNSVLFRKADLTQPQSVRDLASSTFRRFGRIDILVNAAMGVPKRFYAPVETYRWQDWNEIMTVNAGGTFLSCQAVGKFMRKQRSGSIINIGSIYGVVAADQRIYGKSGINSPAVYAASKAAVIQLTKYLAVYWASYGIRVNCISPGGISNHQKKEFVKRYASRTPLGRMVDKEELRGALLYLVSDVSSAVTGHNLIVDGGWTAW